MKLNIEINNLSKSPVKNDFIKRVVRTTLAECGYEFLEERGIELSFSWVIEEKIRELNRIYRKKNKVTDVLSFPEFKSKKALENSLEKELFLGEIILCYNDIKEYVSLKKDKKTFQGELAKVISHGVLHFLGMRHGRKMFKLQEDVAKSFS
jgi:probable rRNA maturation factor